MNSVSWLPSVARGSLMALVVAAAIGASAPSYATLLLDTNQTVVSGDTGTLNPAGVSPALTPPPTGTTATEISFTLNSSGTNTITFGATDASGTPSGETLVVTGGGQSGVAANDGLTPGLYFELTEGVRRLELNPDVDVSGDYEIMLSTADGGNFSWVVTLDGNGENRELYFSDPLDSLIITGGSIVSLGDSQIVDLIQPRFGGVCDQDCDGTQVSEPGTLAVLGFTVLGFGLVRRFKAA